MKRTDLLKQLQRHGCDREPITTFLSTHEQANDNPSHDTAKSTST